MEVSGQLHVPAALPPGKDALVPVGYKAKGRKEERKKERKKDRKMLKIM
jgi:hypothetical protein